MGWWSVQIAYRPAKSDTLAEAFTDSTIYGHWTCREQDQTAISWKNLLASMSVSATGGQRGFPSVRHAKSFEDACEIVGAPAMTQYERSRDGSWVLTYPQVTSRLAKQSLEPVVHVELLEEDLHQRRRPPDQSRRGDRRTNGPRPNVPTPAFRRCFCRRRATSVLARARSAT